MTCNEFLPIKRVVTTSFLFEFLTPAFSMEPLKLRDAPAVGSVLLEVEHGSSTLAPLAFAEDAWKQSACSHFADATFKQRRRENSYKSVKKSGTSPCFLQVPCEGFHLICAYLGPDFAAFRCVSVWVHIDTDFIDLSLQILRWHVFHSSFVGNNVRDLDFIDKIRIRCSQCQSLGVRRIYRVRRSSGTIYFCSNCLFQAIYSSLLGVENHLLDQNSFDPLAKVTLVLSLFSCTRFARSDFASELLRATYPLQGRWSS